MSPEGPKENRGFNSEEEKEETLSGELLDEAFKKRFNPFKINGTREPILRNKEEVGWDGFYYEFGKAFDSSVYLVAFEKNKGIFREHTGFDRHDFSHPEVDDSYHEFSKKGFLKAIDGGIEVARQGIELVKEGRVRSTRWQDSLGKGDTSILEKDIDDLVVLRAWVEENVQDSSDDMPDKILFKKRGPKALSKEESKKIDDELEHAYDW